MTRILLGLLAIAAAAIACGTAAGTPVAGPESTPSLRTPAADQTAMVESTATETTCLDVSPDLVGLLTDSLTIAGGGGIAKAAAIPVRVGPDDEGQWWLVAAALTGAGMDKTVAVWLTGSDPTASAEGPIYSAEGMAEQFSQWGSPPAIKSRFGMFDPDIKAARACLE